MAREREEQKQKRQKDVLESTKYYTDADWNEIMGQVHANQGLSADLLGPDVNEDNFAERMVAIIAERRRKFAAQRFQDKRNKPMTYAQQRDYMRTFVKNQSSTIYTTGWTMKHVRRSLKRQGADLEQPDSKKSKSTEPQKTSVPAASRPSSAGVTPDVHQSPFVDTPPATPPHSPKASSHPDVTPDTSKQPSVAPTPPSGFSATPTVTRTSGPRTRNQSSAAGIKTYSTRRKSLGSRKMSSSEVDLNAADKSFIKVLSDDDSDDSDDKSSKYFTHLREILHLLDRQDLSKLYGMVVKHYEANPIAGAGMMLWGDLHSTMGVTLSGSQGLSSPQANGYVVKAYKIRCWLPGKDTSNPFLAVMTCQKSYISFHYTEESLSKGGKWFQSSMDLTLSGCGGPVTVQVSMLIFLLLIRRLMKDAFGDGVKMLLFNPLCSPTGKANSIVGVVWQYKSHSAGRTILFWRKDLSMAGPTYFFYNPRRMKIIWCSEFVRNQKFNKLRLGSKEVGVVESFGTFSK
ncbi:hypothetical protein Tco_1041551 [Tanacetum coccineum]|uniref:Uncharacterized protein n=1 Tax=Tanacetum coccineum TaxID=301880 RepID=A0ABQ5GH42_9ASTR